ncbi:hypothetical protein N5U06_10875 [Aliarcobacter butzleri]|nr:hypothetical protein [Aliarcobacter butzleri]MCT7592645.1 hypothetical protein [Aliarcobacter butzleri]MCT7631228.1 hypothetical protein [Aliarcobacter butzleri]
MLINILEDACTGLRKEEKSVKLIINFKIDNILSILKCKISL